MSPGDEDDDPTSADPRSFLILLLWYGALPKGASILGIGPGRASPRGGTTVRVASRSSTRADRDLGGGSRRCCMAWDDACTRGCCVPFPPGSLGFITDVVLLRERRWVVLLARVVDGI
jgi:hypothetical protein